MRHIAIGALTCLCWACGSDQPAPDTGLPRTDLFAPQKDYGTVGCSRGSCSGCCRDGECLDGTDPAACGHSGQACLSCGPGATCPAGTCEEPSCDATTCKEGCCHADGTCKGGRSPDACGTAGASCAACSADQGCVAQKCVDKGPPMHKVTLVSSKISGSSLAVCGFAEFSACDLYVILKVGNATATSTIVVNANEPQWNEYLLTALDSELTTSFEVEVRDDDPVGSVQVGKCTPAVTPAALVAGELITDCGSAKDLTFSFQPI